MGGFTMWNRRQFIQKLGLTGALVGTGFGIKSLLAASPAKQKITILHTNDLHSRIEPFPKSDPNYSGLGGFARLNALVQKIRREEKHVLLFDSGDVFQGTPYFNFFKGEAEFKLMSKIGYDAGNVGNHEFDNGIEGIESQLKYLNFPLLNANYDFTDTRLEGKIPPYKIFEKGDMKIGVFGLGIDLSGYVEPHNYGKIVYLDPLDVSKQMVKLLKQEHNCGLVICLSHLGHSSNIGEYCDVDLAAESSGIDVILGGHSHVLLPEPQRIKNTDGKEVIINQVGWSGIALGRLDFYIDNNKNIQMASSQLLAVDGNIV